MSVKQVLSEYVVSSTVVDSLKFFLLPCLNYSYYVMQVWAVLKPGYLALLNNPFDAKLLDIIVFDVLPTSNEKGENPVYLAEEIREKNPLRYAFKVCFHSNCLISNFNHYNFLILGYLFIL